MVPFLFCTILIWYIYTVSCIYGAILYGTMVGQLDPNSLVLIHPVLWNLYKLAQMRSRWGTDTWCMYKEWINSWPLRLKWGTFTSHADFKSTIYVDLDIWDICTLWTNIFGMDGRTNEGTDKVTVESDFSHLNMFVPKYVCPKICSS